MIPWKHAMISGWMLDPKGKKMSKSKGNVIAPQGIIEKYGADALRYMSASCTLGEDLAFPEKDVITGKKTVTKLWNASKFVIMNLGDKKVKQVDFDKLTNIDKWLMQKLKTVIKNTTEYFESYQYFKAKFEVDNFFWSIFCDNYLEIVKDKFFNPEKYTEEEIESSKWTLYKTLLDINKMFAPIIPFITEEVYQIYFKQFENKESIHLCSWPKEMSIKDEKVLSAGNLAIKIISAARKHKSENKMSLKEELQTVKISCSNKEKDLIKMVLADIKATAKIKEIVFAEGDFNVDF
jgi:valyl-tRNA synthetase